MATKNANLPQEVQQTLSIIPELSGSYQYYDKDGEIIYVGKAKNLKNIRGNGRNVSVTIILFILKSVAVRVILLSVWRKCTLM